MNEQMIGSDSTINQGSCIQATPEHIARIKHFKKHKGLYYDFARYVIGWQFPHWQDERLFHEEIGGKLEIFAPDTLENVIMHVTNWCDEHNTGFSIAYGSVDNQPGNPDYTVMVNGFESTNELLCITLIEACLWAEQDRAQEHKVMP